MSSVSNQRRHYHCSTCNFDLCEECYSIFSRAHPLHRHPLRKTLVSQVYGGGTWGCDHCKRMNVGPFAYHCSLCDFDLCGTCFHSFSHPLHEHPLVFADTRIIYEDYNARWFCDHCRMESLRSGAYISHHCSKCQFDLCSNCVAGRRHYLHPHELLLANSHVVYSSPLYMGQWFCDNCKRSSQSTGEYYMWHCKECQFDLCMSCISLPPPPCPSLQPKLQNQPKHPDPSSSQTQPQVGMVPGPSDTEDANLCIVCMDHVRNAGIIHGNTSHVVCCWDCAQTLKESNQPCPICRKKIDLVVQQFIS